MGVSNTMGRPRAVLLLIIYASVVAVHGLRGHRESSWTKSSDYLWLIEFINLQAAVYTYGYPSGTSHTTVAQDLVRELDIARSTCSSFKRPVIFLTHGLGGLIVKEVCCPIHVSPQSKKFQALILLATYREESHTGILANTRAVFFFGVQHRGIPGSTLQWAGRLARWTSLYQGRDAEIYPSRNELTRMVEAFAKISSGFEIFTLIHTLRSGHFDLVVGDPLDNLLGLPNERVIYINATYANMCKFSGHEDSDMWKVIEAARRTTSDLGQDSQTLHWSSDQLWRLNQEER